ncbi:MAG: hypothetical protein V1753_07610 [Pseudomonadota bacterium]
MSYISQEEQRKKALFDAMSTRGKARVLKKGYDAWDPFEQPKDPIDLRMQRTFQIAQALVARFYNDTSQDKESEEYKQGVWDACVGIVDKKDFYKGVYDFCAWYSESLKK